MNVKKLIAGVLACCIAGGVMPTFENVKSNTAITANAVAYKEGTYEQLFYINYGDHIEITGCDKSATSVVIPTEIEGLPVISIGYMAFSFCSSLTDITIPNGVTSIGSNAFYGCSSLIDITIPESVASIASGVFYYCSGLTSIDVSENNNNYMSKDGVLFDKNKTTLIAYPEGKKDTEYIIPDSITIIGNSAFCWCLSLTDITIPDNVTNIGDCAFESCLSLTDITIPNSVTSIGVGAFENCSSLEKIVIENPECEIGDSEYTMNYKATIYGYENSTAQAYAEKYKREFVSLGEAPEIIGGEEECTEGTYEQLTYKKYSDHIEISGCDKSAKEAVIPAEIEGLPVTSIGDYAFYMCSSLTDITIPDSVTSIEAHTFEHCSKLTDITIPDSVTNIGDRAFCDCSSLTDIAIPDSVTSIGVSAFNSCSSLMDITIPDSVTSIGDRAFESCSSLTEITIPDSITSIGVSAFAGCSNLADIKIPDSVTSIGSGAFAGCSSLADIKIPDSVTSIDNSAFNNCTSLSEITIPDGVTSIDYCTFQGCSNLTDITIPDSVANIGNSAFNNCSRLEKIVIENPECGIYDSESTISDTATIYGYTGSTAQAYAEKYERNFVSLGEAPETAGGDALIGDANCDGTVDLADATAIIQHIGNEARYALSEQGLANADCNSDGKITGADALAIQKLEAKLISSLPDVN